MKISDCKHTEIFKILGDETRLRLIRLLFREELGVLEIAEILQSTQPTISRNLMLLKKVKIVEDRRDKNRVFYKLTKLEGSLQHLQDFLKNIGQSEHPDLERLEKILKNRIIEIPNVKLTEWEKNVAALYNPVTALPALAQLAPRGLTVTDFGTGTGKMLPILSEFATQVYAVDYSSDALNFAKQRCNLLGINNIKFICADFYDPSFSLPLCDGIIMHFVIHQLRNPFDAIKILSKFLKSNGRLVIIDRIKHNDESATEKFGSQWLGFSEKELKKWFRDADLNDIYYSKNTDLNSPVEVFTISGGKND